MPVLSLSEIVGFNGLTFTGNGLKVLRVNSGGTGFELATAGSADWNTLSNIPAVISGTTASYTTALDTKLSGIATGATANSSDATLLNRANHTGALPASAMPALTGDITTSAGAVATTLATVNANTGTFGSSSAVPMITVDAKGRITAVSTTAPQMGYNAGSGGTVTQLTSKSTAVTLNRPTGEITLNAASLAAATVVTFVLNNTIIVPTDQIICTHQATGTFGAYTINARATGMGAASIAVRNNTAAALAEAIVIKYSVVRSATA